MTADAVRRASVAVDDGRIVAVGAEAAIPAGERRVDASGKLVLPGAVDPHVHIDAVGDYVGSYPADTAAAALGGVTTVIDFAWQGGDRSLDPDRGLLDGIEHKRALAAESVVDVGLHGAITREDPAVLDEIDAAIDRGVTSFKTYMSTYPVGVSNGFIDRVMRRVAAADAVAMVHTEDPSVCDHRAAALRASGRTAPGDYPRSRPDYAEAMGAASALRMAAAAGAKYYGMHTTCRAALDEISRFRTNGSRVRAETCPQYLLLDAGAHRALGSLSLLAPPLRSRADAEALLGALRRGGLDVVSTDHVPIRRASKAGRDWWDCPFGTNGVQWGLSLLYDVAVVRRGLPVELVARVKAERPAETFGLERKGRIAPGMDADLVVLDPEATVTIDPADNASNADYSIYEGRTVRGVVERTYVRGHLVADAGSVVAPPGTGGFVGRSVPAWAG